MLKYCSGESRYTRWCRIAVGAIVEVEYLKNAVYCLLSLLSSLLWKPTPALFDEEGEERGKWRTHPS